MTETVRRGVDMLVAMYPQIDQSGKPWTPPLLRDLGEIKVPESQWRELANIGHHIEQLGHERKL